MPKYYVKCGNCKVVRSATSPLAAAVLSVSTWGRAKRKMEKSIRVSEVGFDIDGDHPHHGDDILYDSSFVKRKAKK